MKKVILISGTNRSGSSLLDLMIGNSNNGFSTGELHRLFRPSRPIDILNKNGRNEFGYDNEVIDFWNDIKSKGEKNVYDNLFNSFDGIDFIVDSSKNPIWIRNQIKYSKNKYYKLINLISYKTPLEFAYSIFKRNQSEYWKRKSWINKHLILFYLLQNFFTVKYSNLIKNPSEHLELICKKIGIDYFREKENFWKNNSKKFFLFGSDTLRKSEKLLDYSSQYDSSYLAYVKNEIDISDRIYKDILMILDAHEVGLKSKLDYKILKKKEKIGHFSISNKLKFELGSTKYYEFNHIIDNFKKNTVLMLQKINSNENK